MADCRLFEPGTTAFPAFGHLIEPVVKGDLGSSAVDRGPVHRRLDGREPVGHQRALTAVAHLRPLIRDHCPRIADEVATEFVLLGFGEEARHA